ncbi:MAG TPA: hypothetical protein VGT61_01900 [Thermomicrobiales bacterium]|jgi:hypothetical protein|nr:hypothetical protein [Thermomicrobiales bacterium]
MDTEQTMTRNLETVTCYQPQRSRMAARVIAPVAGLAMLALVAAPATNAEASSAMSFYAAPAAGLDPELDTDSDGLTDVLELEIGTDIYDQDSDTDLVLDGEEVNEYGTNPLAADSDEDGWGDGDEINGGTDPNDPEDNPGTDITLDGDQDGLMDERELEIGTDPEVFDTDGDGLGDGAELDGWLTDPLKADTDGDGFDDGEELLVYGTDPRDADDFPSDSAEPSAQPSSEPTSQPSTSAKPNTGGQQGPVAGLPSTGTGDAATTGTTGLMALIAGSLAAAGAAFGLRRRTA